MKTNKYYRITYDDPQHDLTVKVIDEEYGDVVLVKIVEAHSGTIWSPEEELELYPSLIESLKEVEAPKPLVTDGKYLGKDMVYYHRIDGKWYRPISNENEKTDTLVDVTLTKVSD